MFALARGLWRHKVGTVAVICTAVYLFSNDKEPEAAHNNPWAIQQPAVAEEPSIVDNAVDAGMEYLDETGLNPVSHGEETVQRLDNTAAAMGAANREN